MQSKKVVLDFKPEFDESVKGLPEKSQRIIKEKTEFLEQNPRKGKRIVEMFPGEFREYRAGRFRVFYLVEEDKENNTIKVVFLYIDIRQENKKTYGKQNLKKVRKIAEH